jgi:hypothetical protein
MLCLVSIYQNLLQGKKKVKKSVVSEIGRMFLNFVDLNVRILDLFQFIYYPVLTHYRLSGTPWRHWDSTQVCRHSRASCPIHVDDYLRLA